MLKLSTAFSAIFPTLFLSLAASVQLYACFVYFRGQPDWIVTTLFCVLTSGTYLLNRVSDKEDKFNNILRWRFFNLNRKRTFFWKTISILKLITPIFALILLDKLQVALQFTIIAVAGFAYTVKAVPKFTNYKFNWVSIKDIPVGKNIIVCTIWAGSALAVAASVLNISFLRSDLILLFITFFVGTCNSNITSDARDIIGDKMRNIKTIPNILGLKKTYVLLTTINIAGLLVIFAYSHAGIVSIDLALYAAFTIIWASLSTIPQYFLPNLLSKTMGELLVDSHLFLAAAGLIILCMIR